MIISEKKSRDVQFNDGTSIDFEISTNFNTHVIKSLIDTYKRPLKSAIREIISNAIDANIERKILVESGEIANTSYISNDDSVIVTILGNEAPYPDSYSVSIKDNGIGLSESRVRDIFTKFGASTKRNTNKQIGAFGIGAKSPLAYTDDFTVSTVHNGVKYVYQIVRAGYKISMVLVSKDNTDERNGTEVIIPIKNTEDVNRVKATVMLMMFTTGSIILHENLTDTIISKNVLNDVVKVVDGKYMYSIIIDEKEANESQYSHEVNLLIREIVGIIDDYDTTTDRYISMRSDNSVLLLYNGYMYKYNDEKGNVSHIDEKMITSVKVVGYDNSLLWADDICYTNTYGMFHMNNEYIIVNMMKISTGSLELIPNREYIVESDANESVIMDVAKKLVAEYNNILTSTNMIDALNRSGITIYEIVLAFMYVHIYDNSKEYPYDIRTMLREYDQFAAEYSFSITYVLLTNMFKKTKHAWTSIPMLYSKIMDVITRIVDTYDPTYIINVLRIYSAYALDGISIEKSNGRTAYASNIPTIWMQLSTKIDDEYYDSYVDNTIEDMSINAMRTARNIIMNGSRDIRKTIIVISNEIVINANEMKARIVTSDGHKEEIDIYNNSVLIAIKANTRRVAKITNIIKEKLKDIDQDIEILAKSMKTEHKDYTNEKRMIIVREYNIVKDGKEVLLKKGESQYTSVDEVDNMVNDKTILVNVSTWNTISTSHLSTVLSVIYEMLGKKLKYNGKQIDLDGLKVLSFSRAESNDNGIKFGELMKENKELIIEALTMIYICIYYSGDYEVIYTLISSSDRLTKTSDMALDVIKSFAEKSKNEYIETIYMTLMKIHGDKMPDITDAVHIVADDKICSMFGVKRDELRVHYTAMNAIRLVFNILKEIISSNLHISDKNIKNVLTNILESVNL